MEKLKEFFEAAGEVLAPLALGAVAIAGLAALSYLAKMLNLWTG